MFFVALIVSAPIDAANAETRKLDKDTYLIIIGSTVLPNEVEFQGGTEVIINDRGEVTEGTLASSDRLFPPNHSERLEFLKGTRVVFNTRGEVVSGTLGQAYYTTTKVATFVGVGGYASSSAADVEEKIGYHRVPVPASPSKRSTIPVKINTAVSFHDNGTVKDCVIWVPEKRNMDWFNVGIKECYIPLRPVYWQKIVGNRHAGFVKFKNGSVVEFNPQGEVLKGTPIEDVRVMSADGAEKVFKAGTQCDFGGI